LCIVKKESVDMIVVAWSYQNISPALLKKYISLKLFFAVMATNHHFGFTSEPYREQFLKEPFV